MSVKKWFDLVEMMKDPAEGERLVKLVFRFVAISWGAFFLVWALYTVAHWSARFSPAQAGQFGDTFGAVNALFSGLALTGVAYAVMLQHQELKLTNDQLEGAKAEGDKNQAARVKAEFLLGRQADALLAAARLNAAQSLLNSASDDIHKTVFIGNQKYFVLPSEILRQYMRVTLLDLSGIELPEGEKVEEGASVYRKYLHSMLRDARLRISYSSCTDYRDLREFVDSLIGEVYLLAGQDGIIGSKDDHMLFMVHSDLEGVAKRIDEAKSEEFGTEDWRAHEQQLRGEVANRLLGMEFHVRHLP